MIIYRTDGPWGAGKGANLTPEEADGDLHDLDQRIKTLEENPPVPVSVDHVEMVGNMFSVHLTNGEVDGPFEVPYAALVPRGLWGPGVEYNRLDYFSHSGVAYVVMVTHQSPATFDPAYEVDGELAYAVAIPAADQVYDIGFFIRGLVGGDDTVLFRWVAPRVVRFDVAQVDSCALVAVPFADAVSPPASLALVHVPAGGGAETQFGSIAFTQGDAFGIVSFTASQGFNIRDILEVRAPAAADSAGADLSVTLVAIVFGAGAPLPSP